MGGQEHLTHVGRFDACQRGGDPFGCGFQEDGDQLVDQFVAAYAVQSLKGGFVDKIRSVHEGLFLNKANSINIQYLMALSMPAKHHCQDIGTCGLSVMLGRASGLTLMNLWV
jgi:hypothetical protein